jgi:hypothetical protein
VRNDTSNIEAEVDLLPKGRRLHPGESDYLCFNSTRNRHIVRLRLFHRVRGIRLIDSIDVRKIEEYSEAPKTIVFGS